MKNTGIVGSHVLAVENYDGGPKEKSRSLLQSVLAYMDRQDLIILDKIRWVITDLLKKNQTQSMLPLRAEAGYNLIVALAYAFPEHVEQLPIIIGEIFESTISKDRIYKFELGMLAALFEIGNNKCETEDGYSFDDECQGGNLFRFDQNFVKFLVLAVAKGFFRNTSTDRSGWANLFSRLSASIAEHVDRACICVEEDEFDIWQGLQEIYAASFSTRSSGRPNPKVKNLEKLLLAELRIKSFVRFNEQQQTAILMGVGLPAYS